MKNLILTIDYEVFLGERTGDLNEVLIQPTNRLMDILDSNGSKMTVFWDVLHYYMLCKNSSKHRELEREKNLVEEQIKELVKRGHDVQMHIHPHWLDARYVDGGWVFDYSRFSIQKFSTVRDKNDINTILGCLSTAKELMESVICQIDDNYKIKAYRAGGYLIEPFEPLKNVFSELGITIDSSTCPGSKNDCIPYPFDFRDYPNCSHYKFSDTPKQIIADGVFEEYPIKIFKLSPLFRFRRAIFKKTNKAKKSMYEPKGVGVKFPHKKSSRFEKIMSVFGCTTVQLTTDGGDKSLYEHTINCSTDGDVMILHPKMQTDESFDYIEKILSSNYVKFFSIK